MINKETNQTIIRIGLPSPKSRLHSIIMKILKLSPLSDVSRLVYSSSRVVIYLLQPWDIPVIMESGFLDIAFCGLDTVEEQQCKVTVKHCFHDYLSPLALCKRKDANILDKHNLVVATKYPNLARQLLISQFPGLQIIMIRGAAAALPYMERIDAIFDLVDTGKTLQVNQLHIVETLFHSYPCLIHNLDAPQSMIALDVTELASLINQTINPITSSV